MRRLLAFGLSLAVALPLVVGAAAAPGRAQSGESLYKRLGGYDAIAAVTDDFIGRALGDARIRRMFEGLSTDSKNRFRQHLVEQLCAATGGPCVYTGRSMKASHAGFGITEADWTAAIGHLVATLDKYKVPDKEKNELLALLVPMKSDIVEKP
jgi:hemoglobin